MSLQACPSCGAEHDVSIFVTGQRVRCAQCGIRFDVEREVEDEASDLTVAPLDHGARPPVAPAAPSAGPQAPAPSPSPSPTPVVASASAGNDSTHIAAAVSIPGFDIVRALGKGGMGEVYLARQTSLGRQVAVKTLARHLAADPEFVRRFEKEAAALAALSHPNIVGIIDRGRAGDLWYFAMEYVEGYSLREVIREGPMAPDRAIQIITQVARAIDYAHGKGVIHRDLKPENILVDDAGQVKVADFGLAGILDAEEHLNLTRPDVAMGTFHYMAPEQRKNARDVDARADLYSLGVMMYELLCGEVPQGRFRMPSERVPHLPKRVDEIVDKALESDPKDRYQRASAIFEDLEALERDEHLTHTPGPAPGRTTKAEGLGDRKTETQSQIERATSVVGAAGKGIGRALQVLGLAAILAAIGMFWLFGGDGVKEKMREKTLGAGGTDVANVSAIVRPDSPLTVPRTLRVEESNDRAQSVFDFKDDTAGEAEWYTYRGWWELANGKLVHDVFLGGQGVDAPGRVPRAFLGGERFFAEGFRLEARVRVSTQPPQSEDTDASALAKELEKVSGEQGAQAKLYLYRNKRHFFALTVEQGEVGGYTLSWNLGDGETYGRIDGGTGLPEPGEGRTLDLSMWIQDGVLHGEVNGKAIGEAAVGTLSLENWGKAGVGCKHAVCRFERVAVEGTTRPPPGKSSDAPEPTTEPIEP